MSPQGEMADALGKYLQQDRVTRELGVADGAAGLWRLSESEIFAGDIDVLAYATGWREGQRLSRKRRGN